MSLKMTALFMAAGLFVVSSARAITCPEMAFHYVSGFDSLVTSPSMGAEIVAPYRGKAKVKLSGWARLSTTRDGTISEECNIFLFGADAKFLIDGIETSATGNWRFYPIDGVVELSPGLHSIGIRGTTDRCGITSFYESIPIFSHFSCFFTFREISSSFRQG